MPLCPCCGEENPARFRLCGYCGTALVAAAPAQEVRKTVTVVFSDLKGSTDARASGSTPSAARGDDALLRRRCAAVLERHGGTVEKFIGDAVMAVFGVPRRPRGRRAARRARGGRDARRRSQRSTTSSSAPGACASPTAPASTPARSSPATRPAGQRLVTGDAVNVAARLEQAARRGRDPDRRARPTGWSATRSTRRAGRAARSSRARRSRSPAYRLLGARPDARGAARRVDAPMVGRDARAGALLERAFDSASRRTGSASS